MKFTPSESRKSKSLLVIDDWSIKNENFAQSEMLIKKLEKLEADLEAFYNGEQQLFDDWKSLSFSSEIRKKNKLSEQLKSLNQFHFWVIATSEKLKIKMPEAYKLMKEEQEKYIAGNVEDCRKIEEERHARDLFISEQAKQEFRQRFKNTNLYEEGDVAEDIEDTPPPRNPENFMDFEHIRQMSDNDIREICYSKNGAFELFSNTFSFRETPEQFSQTLRIWILMPYEHKFFLSKYYRQQTGESLQKILEEMELAYEAYEHQKASTEGEGSGFNAEFPHYDGDLKLSPEDLETLKLIYRKLVRWLHPDMQKSVLNQSDLLWQKKIWSRTLLAYRRQNLAELKSLYTTAMVRSRNLESLSISEIRKSSDWLQKELTDMQIETKCFRRLPSWGFSRKRKYETLRKKIKKKIDKEITDLQDKIEKLEQKHFILEVLGRPTQKESTLLSWPRSTHKKRRSRVDKQQLSLFCRK